MAAIGQLEAQRMKTMAVAAAALAVWIGFSAGAAAQMVERTGAHRAWSVFQSGTGADRACFVASKPRASVARRGSQRVEVNRGDIWLMATVRRSGGATSTEVSFIPGYPLDAAAPIRAQIGSARFDFFTREGETAWADTRRDEAVDRKLVDAFRRGTDARLTATSTRGTTTEDTFSLLGFTAAFEDAQRLCR